MGGTALSGWCLLGSATLTVVLMLALTPWRAQPPPPPDGPCQPDAARDFTPAQIAAGRALARAAHPPAFGGMAASLAATVVLGLTPAGAHLVGVAGRAGGGPLVELLLGAWLLALLERLLTLPFAAWSEVVRRRFGLSLRGNALWCADQLRGFVLSTGTTSAALLGLYAIVRAAPVAGWAIAAAAAAALLVALSLLYPVLVEPAFNRFRPMPPGPLRSTLLDLARADGVAVRDVLVADASRRTTALNAYVSGLGPSRRLVVYDTTLERATEREIELVVAHELGHVRRHDVVTGTAIGAAFAAAAVCVAGVLLTARPLLDLAGASSASDPRSLALLLAVLTLLGAVAGPVQALVSRQLEARADLHALDLTADAEAFVAMQRRLAVTNRSDVTPNPLVHALFATHPSAPQRIARARDWARHTGRAEPASGGQTSTPERNDS